MFEVHQEPVKATEREYFGDEGRPEVEERPAQVGAVTDPLTQRRHVTRPAINVVTSGAARRGEKNAMR